jgi:tetratricopeptide (TPR) repeat protein
MVQADVDRGKFRAGLKAAESFLKQWPADRRASLTAARCANRLGQPRRAEIHYAHAGVLDVDDLHDRAFGLIVLNQPGRAVEVYRELLERQPNDALALKRLAAVLIDQKRYSRIPELGERLMRIPNQEVAGRTLSGIGHHVARQYAQAAEDFERVLAADPNLKTMPLPPALFWNHLATDLLALGKSADARAHLMRALAAMDDAGLKELLGLSYHLEGRSEEAERCWREAVERDPARIDAWLDLGRLALARGRTDEAVETLTKAVTLAPESLEANYNLAQAFRLQGKPADADRFQRRATALRAATPQTGGMGQIPEPGATARHAPPRPFR